MPYRRLPKTDAARIKAMKTVLDKEDAFSSASRVVAWKTLSDVQRIYDRFMGAYLYHNGCKKNQVRHSGDGDDAKSRARMFISHFIQVLNLAIQRGEIKERYKSLYGLEEGNYTVPELISGEQILCWGEKIISGEKERLKHGGVPISNPSIAKVSVHFDIFKELYSKQKRLQKLTSNSGDDVAQLRAEADAVLLDLWNQVEAAFRDLPLLERYQKCQSYGLVYYYRRHEEPIPGLTL
ncbi:MAG: hypothetical protein Q4D12_07210 [Bacteroidales bacterium]|nr:hypothetical protein [Bacteroidales bacterium]